MEKSRALDLGQALAETLDDLIAPIRGAVPDWDQDRATAVFQRKVCAEGKDPAGCVAREVLH